MRHLLLSLALLLATSAQAQPAPAPKPHTAQPNVTVLPQPFTIPGLNRPRTLRIYVPPDYDKSQDRYPVLYMHDGQNLFDDATSYIGEWGVDEAMNELARTHGLRVIVVGIDNGGDKRMAELNPWDHARFGKGEGQEYVGFIVNVVKPYIDSHYRTRPERESTAVMGSSMGGLISHYAIEQYREVFSKAGIFSPAYWTAPKMFEAARQPLPADARLYFYMGGQEGEEMTADVKKMIEVAGGSAVLKDHILLSFKPEAKHNESAWQAEFKPAMVWLFQAKPVR